MMTIREDAEALRRSMFKSRDSDVDYLEEVALYDEKDVGWYEDVYSPDAGRIARLVKYVLGSLPRADGAV